MKKFIGWFIDDWVPFKSFDGIWNIDTEFGLIQRDCGYQFIYSKYQLWGRQGYAGGKAEAIRTCQTPSVLGNSGESGRTLSGPKLCLALGCGPKMVFPTFLTD